MSPYREAVACPTSATPKGPGLFARLWRRLQRRYLRVKLAERGPWKFRHLRCENCAGAIPWAEVDVRDSYPWAHKGGCYAKQMLNRGWGPNEATKTRLQYGANPPRHSLRIPPPPHDIESQVRALAAAEVADFAVMSPEVQRRMMQMMAARLIPPKLPPPPKDNQS